MKPVQYFSDEYLREAKKLSPTQIVRFLEDSRTLFSAAARQTSTLISIRIPDGLLSAFRSKCALEQIKYQAKIKELMFEWLSGAERLEMQHQPTVGERR